MCRRILLFVLMLWCVRAEAGFVPEQPIMPVRDLRPNMTGYILTVLKGTEPERLPIKIVSIAPQKPGRELSDEIIIRFTGRHKLAQGMSGSPVYVQGKLIGAVRSGWDMSDQTLACVAPIESMCRVFDEEASQKSLTPTPYSLTSNLYISGLNPSNSSLLALGRTLGLTFTQGVSLSAQDLTVSPYRFRPGDAVSAMFVWGDIEAGAVGTITATSKDGRFLAFGHPVNKAGKVSYPAAKTYIHEVVNSLQFPFKLASPASINGVFTHDREAGAGGRSGLYPPSIGAEFRFKNLDTGAQSSYRFRVIADEFMSRELLVKVFTALAEEAWGSKGQGTMMVNLHIDGKAIPDGWSRRDIFYSDEDILEKAFEQAEHIIDAYLTQPFEETMPSGFVMTVEATQKPRVLLIEDVKLSKETAKPGESITVTVKLRGWRTAPIERKFTMKIPADANDGVCMLVVRGGSVESSEQISVDEGWKSIDSLGRMLTEFKAADANNELILELYADRTGEIINAVLDQLAEKGKKDKKTKKDEKPAEPDSGLLPEEEEYLSETKARYIEEGTMRVFSSEYFIDGMMKRLIHVEK
ncbi:MAG: hypothetical protein IJR85_10695 [Synergistaceae bacterium]|nr:hypothetical protein [Synergistaceae bacterium]